MAMAFTIAISMVLSSSIIYLIDISDSLDEATMCKLADRFEKQLQQQSIDEPSIYFNINQWIRERARAFIFTDW